MAKGGWTLSEQEGQRPPEGDWLGTPYLRFEREGSLARCVVDRPGARNAMTPAMYFGLRRAVDVVNADPALAGLLVTGTGDVFIPGGDLRGGDEDDWGGVGGLLNMDVTPFSAIRQSAKPVVCAVNGIAQGGGVAIAALSDVAVATEQATFRTPEALRGIADTHLAQILPAHLGVARARDLLLTGRTLDAHEALAWGLVTRVVPRDELAGAATSALVECVRAAPSARAHMKRVVNGRYGEYDRMTMEASLATEECAEGWRAFAQRRPPAWIPADLAPDGRL